MNLTFYIHDWFLEVGHSNATIETIRNFPINQYDQIHIIGYDLDSKDKLFPNIKNKITYHKVPFGNLKPFFLKAIFFQIYVFLHSLFKKDLGYKISIGTASLNCDLSIIQFVQKQWESIFFTYRKYSLFVYIYKRVLFFYFYICELILFKIKKVKIVTVSKYLQDYFEREYSYKKGDIITAYSAINLGRFNYEKGSRNEIIKKMITKHPDLKKIDFEKPVFLFVGAYERKGLKYVIDELEKLKEEYQFIIIGKPEQQTYIKIPSGKKIVCIEFTRDVDCFYSIADIFIFPTLYEPFGLVILEAAMMGMQLIVTQKYVGASEILENIEDITLYKDIDSFTIPKIMKLSEEKRLENISVRKERLSTFTWENTSELIFNFIKTSYNE